MNALSFPATAPARAVTLPGPWLRSFTLARVDGAYETKVADGEEALALVLAGTLDLYAGGSSWLQRGLRATPFVGRPCGVYLPPKVGFRCEGAGEVLLVAGRRPPSAPSPAAAQPDRASLPLLPLAGGKAFDARTGTWEMLERFPSSPEAVLPRAIEQVQHEGARVERVFSFAFKAQTLCLDEFVVEEGGSLRLPRPQVPPGTRYGDELALFHRCAGDGEVVQDEAHACTGDGVLILHAGDEVVVRARTGPVYGVAVWAGAKPS